MNKQDWSRRRFLEFMGRGSAAAAVSTLAPWAFFSGCSTTPSIEHALPFTPLSPSSQDDLILTEGLHYKLLIQEGDVLNARGETFGTGSDYLTMMPIKGKSFSSEAILWANHEFVVHPSFHNRNISPTEKRRKEEVLKEMHAVGGSLVKVQKNKSTQEWSYVKNDSYNRRLHALTPIPFVSDRPILGKKTAIGTFGNCAGGFTPWNTVLTCEENVQFGYGERVYKNGKPAEIDRKPAKDRWWEFFNYPPEHYGWVVEINPYTGKAKKLCAMGRFAHESATVVLSKDGRCVVYMGDDSDSQCLYKFIAQKPESLERGTLYVANLEQGRWIPLEIHSDRRLEQAFTDQTDLLIQTRLASQILGGTPLDRPEDIEVDPLNKAVYVALTNNFSKGNKHGTLLKLVEKDQDPLSLEFQSSTFLTGGTAFSCPDNLCFDGAGNLWMVTDMSTTVMHQGEHRRFKNNGLFWIPMRGPFAGSVFQMGSAPSGAELTGPWFADDGTFFLSVQHPGEGSLSPEAYTSHWPRGGNSVPRSAVVTIQGPLLEKLRQNAL